MNLPEHRRIQHGRTFAAPYSPAVYGCAGWHYRRPSRLRRLLALFWGAAA